VISRPLSKLTVLVLGAGASMPYDFPSGEELFNRVRRGQLQITFRREPGDMKTSELGDGAVVWSPNRALRGVTDISLGELLCIRNLELNS
jgi:hypothetical protein